MSLIDRVLTSAETENVQSVPGKKFGITSTPSIKKKALADVKNTLQSKSIQSACKPSVSITPSYKGKSVTCNSESKNISAVKEGDKNFNSIVNEVDKQASDFRKENVEPVCSCYEVIEDDYADIMFKNLQLTRRQIEDVALIWENPSPPSKKDVREIDLNVFKVPALEFEDFNYSSLLDEVTEVDNAFPDVPFVNLDLSVFNDSCDVDR